MTSINLTALPEPIICYLSAHRAREVDLALSAFAADAVVTDNGHTHRGRDAIRAWLARSSTEFTYTIEPIGAQRVDDQHFVVVQHLEGDFPGGTADLHYRFVTDGQLIVWLIVEP